MKIGVISDTHGIIHPGAFTPLEGVNLILHAGDIGSEDVISDLETIAPVMGVSGNTDTFPLAGRYKPVEFFEAQGKRIYLTHRFMEGEYKLPHVLKDIASRDPHIVVFGHTHMQYSDESSGRLLFNPGSAGHTRPGTRPGVGVLTIANSKVDHQIYYLD